MNITRRESSKKEITAYDEVADVFTRLEVQLNQCWLGRRDKQEELVVVDNNIATLKAIEYFVLDIEFENVPEISLYDSYVENKNTEALNTLQRYFNRLRFDRDRLPPVDILSKHAQIFFNACQRIEFAAQIQSDTTKIRPLLSMSTRNLFDNIHVDLEQSTRLSQLIESIRKELDSPSVQAKIRADRVPAQKKLSETIEYVDACFIASPQLFVICMDLGFPSQGKQPQPIQATANDKNQINSYWSALTTTLYPVINIIGHFEKLEYTLLRGYSLHATFLCLPNKLYTENDWSNRIGQLWMQITNGQGAYHNFNPEIRKFSDHAAGLIKATEKSKRDAMLRWVARYSTLSSLYVSVPYNPIQVYKIGKQPQVAFPLVSQTQQDNGSNKQIASAFILSPKEVEDAWKIPRGNLTHHSFDQIKERPIIYKEIAALFRSNQSLPINAVSLKSLKIELLVQIETFIAYTSDSSGFAFNTSSHWGDNPTDIDAMKWRTRLGKQLIDLYSHCNYEYVTTQLLPNIEYLSPRVKIYCDVVYRENVWKEDRQIPAEMTTRSLMRFYNCFITQVRLHLQSDHQVLNQFNDLKRASLFSVDDLRVTNNYGKKIESTSPAHPAPVNVIGILPSKRPKSVRAYLDEQYKSSNTTFEDIKLYVSEILKKDVILISLKFHINFGTHDIPQQTSAKLLTLFMRYGKNCKPLAWSLGYVGRWEHVAPMQRCAHVIFFMHADLAASVESVTLEIKKYWAKIISEKANQVITLTPHESFILVGSADESPISHLHNSFNEYFCQIESTDKDKQKVFKQEILLYFAKSTLYYQPNQSELPKALIKGHLATAKRNLDKRRAVKVYLSNEQNISSMTVPLQEPAAHPIINTIEHNSEAPKLSDAGTTQVTDTLEQTGNLIGETSAKENDTNITFQTSSDIPETSSTQSKPNFSIHPRKIKVTMVKPKLIKKSDEHTE